MRQASLNRELNLVMELDLDDGGVAYVHNTPVSFETFEEYGDIMSRTFAGIYSGGLGVTAGPRVAYMRLRRMAEIEGVWKGAGGVEMLMAEIRRRTHVVMPTAKGHETLSLEEATSKDVFDRENLSEVENAIVFFSLIWRMHHRDLRPLVAASAMSLWSGHCTSLGVTDFVASLTTSTTADSTGETPPPTSSVPS